MRIQRIFLHFKMMVTRFVGKFVNQQSRQMKTNRCAVLSAARNQPPPAKREKQKSTRREKSNKTKQKPTSFAEGERHQITFHTDLNSVSMDDRQYITVPFKCLKIKAFLYCLTNLSFMCRDCFRFSKLLMAFWTLHSETQSWQLYVEKPCL